MRVPTAMRWPGHLNGNSRCDELASTLDLLPTIAHLVGAEMPADRVVDGKDISNLLNDPGSNSPHDYFYYFSIRSEKLNAIRDAEGYKLHLWRDPEGYENTAPYEVKELYFLPDDVDESDNIYTERPDVVKRLSAAASSFDAELAKNSRPVGKAP